MKMYCAAVGLWLASMAGAWAENETETEDRHGHALEEITVTATPLKRSAEDLAQPTSVLAGEALARKQAASLGETLSGEAGVTSSYFGPVASRPVIRGQSGERVRILQDSLGILDVSALSEDHQVALEGILTERVEIVRGPATLLYGSAASGGLVNVIDNRIADEPPEEKAVSGVVAASMDSAMDGRVGAARVDAGNQSVSVHLDFARRLSGNVEIPGFVESARQRAAEGIADADAERDVVENTDAESNSGAASISFFHDAGFVGLSISRFESNYGVPGEHGHEEHGGDVISLDEEEQDEYVRIGLDQTRLDLKAAYAFGGLIEEARLRIGRNDYTHTEFEGPETGTVFDSEGLEARLELAHRELFGWNGAFGVQRKSIMFDAIGEEAFVPASSTVQTSAFIFEERPLNEWLTLQTGARLEHQSLSSDAIPSSYSGTAYSASVGAIAEVTGSLQVAANLSRSQRHPSATELFAGGPHVALSRFERGAFSQGIPAFEKETTLNTDLSLSGEQGRLQWALTGFFSQIDNYIFAAPAGGEEDGFPVFNYRQTDAEFYGYEADARLELYDGTLGHVHLHVFSDYVYGEEFGDGPYLPRLPPLRYGAGLDFSDDKMSASLEVVRHDRQDKTAFGELPSDAYTLVSADFDYHVDRYGLWLFLRGTNLTDEEARQHSSPVKELIPLPGRGVSAGVRYEF